MGKTVEVQVSVARAGVRRGKEARGVGEEEKKIKSRGKRKPPARSFSHSKKIREESHELKK